MKHLVLAVLLTTASACHALGSEVLSPYDLRPPSSLVSSKLSLGQVITYELITDRGKEKIMPAFRGAEVYTFEVGSNSICKSISTTLFGNVSHPGGNRGGRLNERTDGYGVNCFMDNNKNSSLFVYGMTNSQFKPTFAIGMRTGLTLFERGGLRLDLGVGGTFVAYERANNRFSYGVIPIRYEKLSYEFILPWKNVTGSVSITQDHLLPSQIRLRSVDGVITIMF
jgi:hypothetical protein